MTRDDIIRMKQDAELWAEQELQCIGEYHPDFHEVADVRFAALVAAHEREQCARVCDGRAMKNEQACEGADADEAVTLRSAAWQMSNCAAAIRARGQK